MRVRNSVCMANGLAVVIVLTNLHVRIVRRLNKFPVWGKTQFRSGDNVFSNN